jgi:SNF2 family DNA or RNA helicase
MILNKPNIITENDELLNYNFEFNNFEFKSHQNATINKMVLHENFHTSSILHNSFQLPLDEEIRFKRYKFNDENMDTDYNDHKVYFNNFQSINRKTSKFILHTNIGVLSLPVGAGKTATTLGLIKYKKLCKKYSHSNYMKSFFNKNLKFLAKDITDTIADYHNPNINCQLITYCDKNQEHNNLIKTFDETKKYIKSNLIVVPHSLFEQWKNEIQTISNFKVKYISTKRDFNDINNNELSLYFSNFDIVLCNANKLKQLIKLTEQNIWSRIFIDEVDTINISNFPYLQSHFLWLISATYKRILKPKNKGFITDLFHPEISRNKLLYELLLNTITYTCDKKYINKNIILDKPKLNYIIYKSPFINKILYNINNNTINTFINSNDFNEIINYFIKDSFSFITSYIRLGERTKTTLLRNIRRQLFIGYHDNPLYHNLRRIIYNYLSTNQENIKINIIILYLLFLISKIYIKIREINDSKYNYRRYIRHSNSLRFSKIEVKKSKQKVSSIRKTIINKLKKYHYYITELEYIKNEFVNNKLCIFCHKSIDNDLNIYCNFSCNYELLLFKNNFHFFDDLYDYSDIIKKCLKFFDIDLNISNIINNYPKLYNTIENIKTDYNVKINNIIKIINSNKDNKIKTLLFSDNINFFNKIKEQFEQYKIKYKILKGNRNVINSILRKYKNNEIDVLLLNMKFMGSGLNLEMTNKIYIMNYLDEDTEIQVIGRANRYGRTGELEVNYIFYEEEYELYKINNKEINEDNSSNDMDVEEI